MNTRPFIYVALILGTLGFSQEPTEDDFYQEEVNKLVKIPVSPEAEAFAQYGNTPVNLYSGIPEISIPLHTLPGREMEIPISLTYDASGIKVEALASWVGLNWNLNVGGRITRMVNGLPDDYFAGGSYSSISTSGISDKINSYSENNTRFPDQTAAITYFNFLKDIQMNLTDAEPDYYTLSLPGINETIVIDITDNNTPKVLNNPRIKVEMTTGSGIVVNPIVSWKITHEDGTIYHFGAIENTEYIGNDTQGSGAINYQYTSSWLLTRIESSNKKDDFVFNYSNSGYWADPQPASSAGMAVTKIIPTQNNYPPPNQDFAGSAQYKTSQQFLTSISNNGKTLVTVILGNRLDVNVALTNTRLERLDFQDYLGQSLKSIHFDNQDYFNLDGLTVGPNGPLPAGKDRMDVRLKLNGLQIKGSDDKTYQTYSFEYDRPDDLPTRSPNFMGMDKLGYYNGADGNSTLYPSYNLGNYVFAGANRNFSPTHARIGLLKKITYPTGGFTEFEFESHDIYQSSIYTNTIPHFVLNVNDGTPVDLDLFTSGGHCYDPFAGFDARIKIETFVIEETGEYDINLLGQTSHSVAYIQHIGPICRIKNGVEVCPENPYTTYCEFRAVSGSALFNSDRDGTSLTTHFDPGTYAAILLLDERISGGVDLNVTQDVTISTSSNPEVGGIRIAQIKDYANSGSVSRIKDYSYRTDGRSTGTIRFVPSLVRIQSFKDNYNNPVDQVLRTAVFPKGDAPYVTYGSVTERILDGNGNSEGHTTYEYYGGLSGSVPRSSPPYENSYFSSLSIGNPRYTKLYNTDSNLVSQTEVQYFEGPEPSIGGATVAKTRGIAVYTDENYSDKVVVLKQRTDPSTQEVYVTYDYRNYYCPPSGDRCLVPVLTDPNDLAVLDNVSTLRMRLSGASGTYGGVSMVARTDRFGDLTNDPKEVRSVETITYEPTVEYLPRRTRRTESSGKTFETVNYYPLDGVVLGSQDLLDKNNRSEIVQQDVVRDPDNSPVLISRRSTDYEAVGTGIVVPTLIKTGKGATASTVLEDRVALDYYSDGLLLESKKADGTSTFYIWNNKGRYPLAKIENATRTQIENASADIVDLTDFKPTAPSLTPSQESDLRSGLPQAMVTTYTYNPFTGLTKMTDPKGYVTFYEYDAFQRLKQSKDHDGHILSDNQYKYATEQ